MSRLSVFLFALVATSAFAKDFSETVGSSLEAFPTFPRVQQRLTEMRAAVLEGSGALDDSPATVGLTLSRNQGSSVSDANLVSAGGLHSLRNDTLDSTLSLKPRNIGSLNSLQLDLSYSKVNHQDQLFPGVTSTANPTNTWASRLSYDLIKGGNGDPDLITNRVRKAQLTSEFYGISKLLIADYLEFRGLLVDLIGTTCKVRNAAKDLEVIEKTAKDIQIAFQVKSVTYKQVLSVLDTRNFVLRNKIGYELDYENSKRQLKVWDAAAGESALLAVSDNFSCDLDSKRIDEGVKSYSIAEKSEADFENTLDYFSVASDLTGLQLESAFARSAEKASLRPYFQLSENDQYGFHDRRFELGVRLEWDVPGKKQSTRVQGGMLRVQGARLRVQALKAEYLSSQSILANRIEKNRELLQASWDAYLNSNRLVHVLEVQKSIGQIDSASVSNAYTQRNQIQNAIFDSLIRMDKDYARWKSVEDWREVLAKAGFKGL